MITYQFNDGGRRRAGYKGRTADCFVRAIAIALELPYQEVYDELFRMQKKLAERYGRKGSASPRNGVYKVVAGEFLAQRGWKWTPTMFIGKGCKVHLKADELPSGRIICQVSRHVVAVVNGVINDTYDCSRQGSRCVYGFWNKS